ETPPEDRYPVQTYVVEFNYQTVADAIMREISRGGQVYFVHNRVMDIERVTDGLAAAVPEARIGVAHGQMREDQLERVMVDFLEGEYDVLVCTTIIESGLDIPNVNTIIVNEADHLGLSQLYQLRGRVGRSNRRAYAYLTYRRDRVLTEIAEKRLQAIREFTEFGSGFKIAMRDMEIRGAGNVLGPEQHGHIMAVGFDMYCRLLEEAVHQLKGEEPVEQADPTVELPLDAFISDDYIPDQPRKMEMYRKIMLSRLPDSVEEVYDELVDRFGDPPPEVLNLLNVARLKTFCLQLGVATVGLQGQLLVFGFTDKPAVSGEQLVKLSSFYPTLTFAASPNFQMKLKLRGAEPVKALEIALEALGKAQQIMEA
ncbi:MAG TPA: TRCF domain-containing protein, partial [Bacillota bacterium]|nr:TRCF domain-containing protein [Bacillota bacterium]